MPTAPWTFNPINIRMKKRESIALPPGILSEIDRYVLKSNKENDLLSLSRTRFIVVAVG